MKVLHVITNLEAGGAQTVLGRLVRADAHDEHRVVSLMAAGTLGGRLGAEGVEVRALGLPRGRMTLAAARTLARLIRDARPEVVQTWMYHADLAGGIAARLAGVRAVVWGIRNANLDPTKVAFATRLTARFCALASRVVPRVVVSCSVRAARAHAALGYAADKLTVVANGYDLSEFAPDAGLRARTRAALGVGGGQTLLGTVARWDPHKDHANLLAALARLRTDLGGDWRCALVGPGLDGGNTALAELVARHGLGGRVLTLGQRDDIAAVLNALDVHVLPSVGEAFPNAVAEAMACGTPGVVTDAGDAALIVGETGWVVPTADPRALAAALVDAVAELSRPALWSARRAACRERIAANFSLERMVSGYRAAWQSALGR